MWFALNFKGPQNISVPTLIILCDSSQKKEIPLLSNTNTASCSLDSSLSFSVSPNVSLSRLLSIYKRNTHVSQWKRIRDAENHVFLPATSSSLPPMPRLSRVAFSSLPSLPRHCEMAFLMATLFSTGSHLIAFPVSSSPLDVSPWMNPLRDTLYWMFLSSCPRSQTKRSMGWIWPKDMTCLASTVCICGMSCQHL